MHLWAAASTIGSTSEDALLDGERRSSLRKRRLYLYCVPNPFSVMVSTIYPPTALSQRGYRPLKIAILALPGGTQALINPRESEY
jgi:hypothetical protein